MRAAYAKELPPEDGEPLVLCAITDWIAVGFPSDPVWDSDVSRSVSASYCSTKALRKPPKQ